MARLILILSIVFGVCHGVKDLGVFGPTIEIIEQDPMEILTKNAKDLNKTKLLKEAKDSVEKALFVKKILPDCKTTTSRTVELRGVVASDVVMPSGNVLYKKGDYINPLKALPFANASFLVANESFVTSNKNYAGKLGATTTFLNEGNITRTQKTLQAPVYPIDKEMVKRFSLRCSPTFVTQTKGEYTFKLLEMGNQ